MQEVTKAIQEQATINAGDLGMMMGVMSKISEKIIEKMDGQADKYLETKIKEIYG